MVRQGKYTKVSPLRQAKRKARFHWRWFSRLSRKKKIMVIAAPILAFLILTPIFTYIYFYNDIADQERLMNRNNTGIALQDKNGKVFYSAGRAEHREMVKLDDISDNVEHALLASEDNDFYHHDGFSITGIARAVFGTITNQPEFGGGSTLTQQLAKTTLLTSQQTFLRKYQELAVSIAIEQRYSKDQILEMYLNSAFMGGNVFGIDEAAKFYYGKSAKNLTVAQSAMLIGILPAPNAYSPTLGNPEYAKERQETVLTRMVRHGYITEEEKTKALAEKLKFKDPATEEAGDAPAFAQMVMEQLNEKYGEEKVARSGYQVRTTLDLTLQKQLKNNIAGHMDHIEMMGGSNASGVAIDPTSGEVRALVGSADWNNKKWGKVNMVTTPRQPGSSFKPIYYAKALADGVITPATILPDVPTDFGGYKPQNASRTFSGDISIRNALSRSLNIPSVKVMEKLGIEKSKQAAKDLGITTIEDDKNYGLSLALGSAEAPLLEMTNAYAAFANRGEQFNTTIIKQINDKFDNNIYKASEVSRKAISEEGAFLISSILSDNNARAPIFGSSLTVPGHTVAVKTGTTDDSRDAWTIGYTPNLAVGVWVGNNNNEIMLSGGSDMAGPIWVATMNEALAGKQDVPFSVPSTIVQRAVCYGNGGLATGGGTNTYQEYFLSWALPSATCTPQQPVKNDDTSNGKKEEETQTDTDTTDEGTTGADGNGTNNGNGGNNGNNGNGNDGDTDDGTTTPGDDDDGTLPGGNTGGGTTPVTPTP